jgi:hypothetical protein
MTLAEYLDSGKGLGLLLAAGLGVADTYVTQLKNGTRGISPERAVQIEQLTGGLVSRLDTCPDTWFKLWPELAERLPNRVPISYQPLKPMQPVAPRPHSPNYRVRPPRKPKPKNDLSA